MTPKQRRFIDEYLVDLNATQAALRAGYSEHTARQIATENLSKPYIQDAIAQAMRERSARTRATADEVLLGLARIARSRMPDYATWGPQGVTLRPSEELTAEQAACVAEVSQTVSEGGGSLRFKLHDQIRAYELLGKHLGLFLDRTEHSGEVGLLIQTLTGVSEEQTLGQRNGQQAHQP